MALLLTGATGNIGRAVLAALLAGPTLPPGTVRAAVRDLSEAAAMLPPGVMAVAFDFARPITWAPALAGVETVFLLRPPQLTDVAGVFRPLIGAMRAAGVRHVIFLSVQGAESSSLIPHHKIEKELLAAAAAWGLGWTFLRPSYFMQNLTTTLRADLRAHRVVLPAGQALFQWVDVLDIGRVAAVVLRQPAAHTGQAYVITGAELRTFPDVLAQVGALTGVPIAYQSPNPVAFLWREHRAGRPLAYALVLVLLHWLPRFFAPPPASDTVRRLTGRPPGTLADFIRREVAPLLQTGG